MKGPNPPGSGKDTAEAKGVCREVESEERIRQNSGLLYLGLNARIRVKQDLSREVGRDHSSKAVANALGRTEL